MRSILLQNASWLFIMVIYGDGKLSLKWWIYSIIFSKFCVAFFLSFVAFFGYNAECYKIPTPGLFRSMSYGFRVLNSNSIFKIKFV